MTISRATTGAFDPWASIIALIPCYNEALHIADVVRRVREIVATVLVIDDASSDDTALRAREAGAEVISLSTNGGKGAAIKTGLRILQHRGMEYVVLLDGDGQHRPEEIRRFLVAAAGSCAGIFVGNRMVDTHLMPLVRKLTNQFMSRQISQLCGQRVPDSQCGFRMVHRRVIPTILCQSNGFDYETEMLIVASLAGERIASVPVSTIYADEKSKIRPIADGVRFFGLVSRYSRLRWNMVNPAENLRRATPAREGSTP